MQEIFTRTSVRQYEERPVEQEKIERILKAAMAAPTAFNQRPWEFYVVQDKAVLQKLSEASQYAGMTAKAPLAIVICCRTEGQPAAVMLDIDCAIATENIWLEAEHLGLGAVMLGIAPVEERMDKVAAILELPQGLKAFTIIPIGYPVNKKQQQDRYEPERVHWIK